MGVGRWEHEGIRTLDAAVAHGRHDEQLERLVASPTWCCSGAGALPM